MDEIMCWFPNDPAQAKAVRAFVHDALDGRMPPDTVDDLLHIADEMFTNAIQHAPGDGKVSVTLTPRSADRLRVTVAGPKAPADSRPQVLNEARCDGERGRGMLIVNALADAWGFMSDSPEQDAVWAEKKLPRELAHAS